MNYVNRIFFIVLALAAALALIAGPAVAQQRNPIS